MKKMGNGTGPPADKKDRWFVYENGKLHFSSRLERRVFFVLTLALLLAGALQKLHIW